MEYIDHKNEKYTVRPPKPEDFPRVREICDGRFGDGYISEEEFASWVQNPDFCKVADYNGTVVGIAYLMPESAEALAKAMKLDVDYVNTVARGKPVIHSRCAALDEAYENRGIMLIMHREIYDNIAAQGFGAVFAPAWTYNGYTPMAKMLEKYEFEFVGVRENLWYDMDGYKCIICNGRCRCNAAIYQKKFN